MSNLSKQILDELAELAHRYEQVLFAVDVMGSVARLKERPRDLDVSLWVRLEVHRSEEKQRLFSKLCDEVVSLASRLGVGLDLRVVYVDVVESQLRHLVHSPLMWLTMLPSVVDASAILHAVKAVDEKTAALLYAVYLVSGWDIVSWHNVWVYGGENVAKLVEGIGIDRIREAIAKLAKLAFTSILE